MKLLCIFGLTTAALLSFGQTNNQPATANNPSIIGNTGRRPRQIGQFMRATTNGAPSATYVVGEQGANHRTWLKVLKTTDLKGHTLFDTNVAYVELASGLNYKDPVTGNWLLSREEIDTYPGGAIAQYGQHKVIFADNLNTSGAIDLQTPDGKDLQSDILGLGYYDSASGKSVLIAQVKDCQGQIVNSNQIIYSDAFVGVRANVRYTYTRAGLEQDVVLLAQPQAFVGWDWETPAPKASDSNGLNWLGQCQNTLIAEWQSGVPLETCMQDYVQQLKQKVPWNNTFVNPFNGSAALEIDRWKLSGCYDLQTYDR